MVGTAFSVLIRWELSGPGPMLGDVPRHLGTFFQDAGNNIMEALIFFHDEVLCILALITGVVFWGIVRAIATRLYHRYLFEGVLVEIVWTLLPAVILICIALPSLQLLYIMDEVTNPGVTLKVVGHQ